MHLLLCQHHLLVLCGLPRLTQGLLIGAGLQSRGFPGETAVPAINFHLFVLTYESENGEAQPGSRKIRGKEGEG